jgi:hypothetical protein
MAYKCIASSEIFNSKYFKVARIVMDGVSYRLNIYEFAMLFDIKSQSENDTLVEAGLSIKYPHPPQYVLTVDIDACSIRGSDRTKKAKDSLRALLLATHDAVCGGRTKVFGGFSRLQP